MDGWDDYDPREKPYAVMSRNPGIGNNYINDENRAYYNNNRS